MTKQDKAPPEKRQKRLKNKLPVLDPDQDLFSAFTDVPPSSNSGDKNMPSNKSREIPRLNKHGLPVIEAFEEQFLSNEQGSMPGHVQAASGESEEVLKEWEEREVLEENFEKLLEASLKQKNSPPKKKPLPMPVKKRLKRYPRPEAELDLHGFTALGAELKAKTFISTCKQQGYFSLRIVVGKGLHSDLGPVLPDVIEDLLKGMQKQNIVLAYEWDRHKKSKSGSLIVYLKQFND